MSEATRAGLSFDKKPLNEEERTAALENLARQMRGDLVSMSYRTGAAHLGSSLSCVEILIAAYWTALRIDPKHADDPDRDRLLFSKGHAVASLYLALAYRGFFPLEKLEEYAELGGALPEHPVLGSLPGIEATTGSLGHGLSLAVGIAMAGRIHKRSYRTMVVMSDGECNEGSVWEAALSASAFGLENVMAIVDYNKWQATGRSDEVLVLKPLVDKWRAFGWSAYEVDGHDLRAVIEAMRAFPDGSGKPVALIAHTVKGKGISFMEDDNNWHYRIPTADEVRAAHRELGLA